MMINYAILSAILVCWPGLGHSTIERDRDLVSVS